MLHLRQDSPGLLRILHPSDPEHDLPPASSPTSHSPIYSVNYSSEQLLGYIRFSSFTKDDHFGWIPSGVARSQVRRDRSVLEYTKLYPGRLMAKPTPANTHNGRTDQSGSTADQQSLDHSLLQPRLAVALGVPRRWHPPLIVARLLSIGPALWWGMRCALRFLFAEFILSNGPKSPPSGEDGRLFRAESSLRLTETVLAMVWCWASGHLAYFFTDCLMSRWLINYTPQATIVRLVTLSCVFSYATSWVVYLTGASQDPGLLLPAWISIATILTACYQITQRKINIRKETRLSFHVFSYASFISMVALLVQSHSTRVDYPNIPLIALAKRAGEIAVRLVVKILGVTREVDGL
ncbi:hypothetical protein DL769_001620 [Monosporascus sp. CRB-8-3]|nr:hypothetical protein DL769_001620 [Monosporascus sp. CRB-8-3]